MRFNIDLAPLLFAIAFAAFVSLPFVLSFIATFMSFNASMIFLVANIVLVAIVYPMV